MQALMLDFIIRECSNANNAIRIENLNDNIIYIYRKNVLDCMF